MSSRDFATLVLVALLSVLSTVAPPAAAQSPSALTPRLLAGPLSARSLLTTASGSSSVATSLSLTVPHPAPQSPESSDPSVLCGDDRDVIILEYIQFDLPPPSCTEFIANGGSSDFPWGELNAPEDNPHSRTWGIFVVLDKLEIARRIYGYDIEVTSGYRCPHVNDQIPNSVSNSRHQFGDGVDMRARSRPWNPEEFLDLKKALEQLEDQPDWMSNWLSYRDHHLHVEWE